LIVHGKKNFAKKSKILAGYKSENFIEVKSNYVERSN